jgi:hypothetical protein
LTFIFSKIIILQEGKKLIRAKKIKSNTFLYIVVIILFAFSHYGRLISQELVFGSHINKMSVSNIEGEKIIIPHEGFVTLLLFFNIDFVPHIHTLSELDFLLANINKFDEKVKLVAISKGEKKKFKEIQTKFDNRFNLINEEKEKKLFKIFNYSCGYCTKIILIDKNNKLRYLSSTFDPIFLREVIQRYSNGN